MSVESVPRLELPATLRRLEAEVGELVAAGQLTVPPYPAVALRVQEAMGRKDFGLAQMGALISADAGLAADILRCANSAMYRRGVAVIDLTQAITRIGEQQVMRLLLASGLARQAQAVGPLVLIRRMAWIEGLAAAALCQELARLRGLRAEEAFTVGLLHDFGKIVALAAIEAKLEAEKITESFSQSAWVDLVERLHVPVGAALASRWGLPAALSEVIATHHALASAQPGRLPEIVRLSDAVVALVLMRTRVAGEDLKAIPGLTPSEREPLARLIEQVPDFVASFETSAAVAHVASPRVSQPETCLTEAPRPTRFGVSISVAKRPRLYSAVAVGPDGLVVSGDEPMPVNRLLEVKLYCDPPLSIWCRSRLCRPDGTGYVVELSPFALSGAARDEWVKLVSGPGAA
jgi:HD-like signal output (HDOD) protein